MRLLAPALRELARMLGRLLHRLRLAAQRRRLARLETALGLLGWQQADYDPGTQQHADRLTACEREQARLANASAQLALAIHALGERRETARQAFENTAAESLAREQPAVADVRQLAERIAAHRREHKQIATRLQVLDRELHAAEEEYRARLTAHADAGELLARRKVILALPRERVDWQERLEKASRQTAALEALLAALRQARTDFEQRDTALASEIAARQREKQRIDKQAAAFETAKTQPLREIGRVLADHDIAPLNQPEVLTAVHAQRQALAAREAIVAASLAASRAENATVMRSSWLALAALALSLLAVGLALLSL